MLLCAVNFEHFSKICMIISVVAAKIWYLKKCAVFIGPPCSIQLEKRRKRLETKYMSNCPLECHYVV